MTSIKENINRFLEEIPKNVSLVAVSKTKPNDAILEALQLNQLDFGENKVQELQRKSEELPSEIRWHYIGHLQSNKVKYIVDFIHLIHGVDSLKLIKEINKRAAQKGKIVSILLQMHIAEESTKFGLSEEDLNEIISLDLGKEFPFVSFKGLMGMATNTDDKNQVREEFKKLKKIFERSAKQVVSFEELSMGMTNDYKIAIEEGSTMIRVGSAIFGERNY